MSPASYLAAPPRGAGRSIASRRVTYGWGALGFCVPELGVGIETAERRAAELPAGLDELARAQARLERSLARAQVLQAAAHEALSPLERARAAVPRKRI